MMIFYQAIVPISSLSSYMHHKHILPFISLETTIVLATTKISSLFIYFPIPDIIFLPFHTVEQQSFFMGKQFQESRGGSFQQRGSFGGRGAPRGRGGSFNNNRGGFDQGPPSYVIPYGTFLHKSENNFVVKCTDMSRFPKFNRGVYLENKSKVGSIDEILGPLNGFYFSVKPAEGINPTSFKEGQVFYMAPEDLLSTDRFTKPQAPRPKGPRTFGAGGPGGRPQQGGRPGGFSGGFSGGFNNRGRGAPRGAPRGRGGPSFRGR